MSLINYSKPSNFCDTVEAIAILISHALVQLRDHAQFQDVRDESVLRAAYGASSLLQDSRTEIERLIPTLEQI